MAKPDPNEPPESIIVGSFSGLKNTVNRERLSIAELETARNIDLDDAGQALSRKGYDKRVTGRSHSATKHAGCIVAVKENMLGWYDSRFDFFGIHPASAHRISYVSVGTDLYYSSEVDSGRITEDMIRYPWGAHGGDSQWISPVVVPTPHLGQIAGKLLGKPPIAEHIAIYNGRIYFACKNVLWHTELYLLDKVNQTRNFYTFEYDITMLWGMDDGLYVGTTGGLSFLAGTAKQGLKQKVVSAATIIPGTAVEVPEEAVHPQARQGPRKQGKAMVCMSSDGILACFDSGETYNLTLGQVAFPEAFSGAALFRTEDGVNTYISSIDSEGTPVTAGARIGDFVEAELRRPFQGG